ncbi:rhomboid protein 1, mitochondrial [Podospora australis]|uniref:Rhomboid protein 1, mitochondrial n=1 Tax=Podospora australis TaxID=1536484 RepID=A0AAN6WZH1_9PEZI|nr:rhomboid protein 1, mitochondrial [Podospora australis]
MDCCTLGVNAFRCGAQIAAQHISRPAATTTALRLLPAAASIPARYLSSFSSSRMKNTNSSHALLINPSQRPLLPRRLGVRTFLSFIPKHYADVPPNYKDEDGLPFSSKELTAKEVVVIFGPHMSTAAANKLLRILHGRRVAGTLEDPVVQLNTMQFPKAQQKAALEYLRKYVPVDEIVNAGLRAEDELAEYERSRNPDTDAEEGVEGTKPEDKGKPYNPGYGSRLKFYKEDTKPTTTSKSVYGESAFDAIRAKNKAKWEAELKRREEEEKKAQAEREVNSGPLSPITHQEKFLKLSPSMQKWILEAQSDLEDHPDMKAWERIVPSAIFVALVVGAVVAYAYYYKPLKRSERLFPDIPPAAATVGAIILANVLVWAMWKMPPCWKYLNRYMLLASTLPKPFSLLGATFSHHKLGHMLPNLVFLWLVGTRLHDEVGRGNFLAIYLAAGTVGFLGTLTKTVLMGELATTAFGASGAIYGIIGAYFWMNRFEGFKIFGLPPPPSEGIHGLTFLALAVGLDLARLLTKARFKIDVTSHLTGVGVGVLAGHLLQKQKEGAKRNKMELGQSCGATSCPTPS